MKRKLPNLLGAIVRNYFTDHLPRIRGTSPHTIHSYRDSVVLLLRFLSVRNKRTVAELDLKDLDPPGILAFLSYLEKERKNGVATRNVRLSALHALFRFVALGPRTSGSGSEGSGYPLQTDVATHHRLPGEGRDRIDSENDRPDYPARNPRLRASCHHV